MRPSQDRSSSFRSAFIVVTSLFFMWGFITVLVDALIPRLKAIFELSYFEAGLVQFAFFTAYAVVSIPSGLLISHIGYKRGVIVGLLTMSAGCLLFYPAASFRVFGIFLLALFVLAGGITTLQVAANPYAAALGPPRTASSRLNLAQAFNSLGTTLAPLVSAVFILGVSVMGAGQIAELSEADRVVYYAEEASAVQMPFLVLAAVLVVLAVVFAVFRLPKILETDDHQSGSYARAITYRHLMLGALAIFLYVGAEVTIGSYLVNYFLTLDVEALVAGRPVMRLLAETLSGNELGQLNPARLAGTFVFFYWGGAMVGRFVGAALLQFLRPGRLLAAYACVAASLLVVTVASSGIVAMWSILAVGLFNSIMFPTIFTLAIEDLSEHTAQGSGILCTAIVGGAVIPPLYGALADATGLQWAFVLPIACYLYIVYYGAAGSRATRPAPGPSGAAHT